MATCDVIIVNNKNEYFNYTITGNFASGETTTPCLEAIDKYVTEELKFEQLFSITESFWTSVKSGTQSDVGVRIKYVNGFCKKSLYKIKEILVISKKYIAST